MNKYEDKHQEIKNVMMKLKVLGRQWAQERRDDCGNNRICFFLKKVELKLHM